MDELGKKLGVKNTSELYKWYNISLKDLTQIGGGGVLAHFSNSLHRALTSAYPEFDWLPWKFMNSPRYIWNDLGVMKKALRYVETQLRFSNSQDWYRVTKEQLKDLEVEQLFIRNGGLSETLKKFYPELQFEEKYMLSGGYKKGLQRHLGFVIREIFPNEEVREDYLHPQLIYEKTKSPMQLDYYLPNLAMAFEFQGVQHYNETPIYGAVKLRLKKDEEKEERCKEKGISLILVPFWWNRSREQLLKTLLDKRPDLESELQKFLKGAVMTSGIPEEAQVNLADYEEAK